jgi:signal transduction histidine kinase
MNERREIDGLDARLSEILAALSHELRNPLNAILGWATILTRRGDLPEPVMQGLQAIERNSRLQARMIADLLDYAAIRAGEVRLAIETIDPYPVVRAAMAGVAATARDAGVAVEASFDDEALRIEADAARLEQIVGNLLSNAVKFSDRGKSVRLAAQRSGDCFRLVVSDQGKGIDPEFLPSIFERFGRHRASTSRSHGGLGLGLALVKQLAELHSGTVRAESAGKGLGATFILELSLCDAARHLGSSPNER